MRERDEGAAAEREEEEEKEEETGRRPRPPQSPQPRRNDDDDDDGEGGGGWRNLGKTVQLAARYHAEGADEIAFLNITSSSAPGPRGVVQVHLRAAHGRGGGYAVTPTRIAGSSHAELHRHGRSVRGE